jgi:hypothetical protein
MEAPLSGTLGLEIPVTLPALADEGIELNCAFGRPWRMKTVSPRPISAFWANRHAWQSSHCFLDSVLACPPSAARTSLATW